MPDAGGGCGPTSPPLFPRPGDTAHPGSGRPPRLSPQCALRLRALSGRGKCTQGRGLLWASLEPGPFSALDKEFPLRSFPWRRWTCHLPEPWVCGPGPASRGPAEPGLFLQEPVSWLETPETGRYRPPMVRADTLQLPAAQRLSEEQPARPSAGGRGTETPTHMLCGPQDLGASASPATPGGREAPQDGWRAKGDGQDLLKAMFQGCSQTPSKMPGLGQEPGGTSGWPGGLSDQALPEGRSWPRGTSCQMECVHRSSRRSRLDL